MQKPNKQQTAAIAFGPVGGVVYGTAHLIKKVQARKSETETLDESLEKATA